MPAAGPGRLSAAELDEFVRLYQRVSAHLSYAQTNFGDPGLIAQLSRLIAAAGAIVYGTRPRTMRSFGRFFTRTFPAALWQVRRFVVVSAVLTFGPALAVGVWLANSPQAVQATGPAAVRQAYVNQDFESYYSSQPAAAFATEVYTNNVRVALFAFAGGILVCLPTVYLLVNNGANLGLAAGLFSAAGQSPKFYGLIIPHGLIELTSVVIAGAAGLRLGWTLIDPGDRTRLTPWPRRAGGRSSSCSASSARCWSPGLIEGFVTGSTPADRGAGRDRRRRRGCLPRLRRRRRADRGGPGLDRLAGRGRRRLGRPSVVDELDAVAERVVDVAPAYARQLVVPAERVPARFDGGG